MKKIYIILLFIGLPLLPWMHSCTDLNETVYDQIPTDQYGNNSKEIASLVAPVYNSVRNARSWSFRHLLDEVSDMQVVPTRKGGDWWDGGQHMYAKTHTWTNNNCGLITGLYNDIYGSISTCNKVLKLVEGIEMDGKNLVIAEIRGVRALFYYHVIDNFGQAPLVVSFDETALPTSASRKVLYDFVISELAAIKDSVRADVTSASYGKFTKGAAYALLAKMYLNAEVWTGIPEWQKCVDACNVVMGLPYILESDWKISFAVKNELSKEIIFPAVFQLGAGGNNIANYSLHYLDDAVLGLNLGSWNGCCADPNYVKEYDQDDKRYNWSFLTGPMKDPATGLVVVTAHSRPLIHTPEVTMYEATATNWGWCNQEDGARIWKWEIPKGLAGDMDNDFAILRLADIYLMKAESLVRLSGSNSVATDLVNAIRARAFSPAKPVVSASLDDVRKERRYEFAWEQMSRQDNIRFGTFLNAVPGWRGVSDPKHLLFPIPKDALDVNPGLTQNPGY